MPKIYPFKYTLNLDFQFSLIFCLKSEVNERSKMAIWANFGQNLVERCNIYLQVLFHHVGDIPQWRFGFSQKPFNRFWYFRSFYKIEYVIFIYGSVVMLI